MTQPIQEPTTQRSVSGLNWGQSQLARRPAIAGTCPCPLDWAFVQGISTASAANDTPTPITWIEYGIAPGSSAFSIDIGTPSRPIWCLLKGFYQFWLDFEWQDAGFTDVRAYYLDITGGGFWDNNDSTFPPRGTVSDPYFSGGTFSWGPLHVHPTAKVRLNVWQKSLLSQDINTGFLTAVYLGPGLGIDDGVTDWTDTIQNF